MAVFANNAAMRSSKLKWLKDFIRILKLDFRFGDNRTNAIQVKEKPIKIERLFSMPSEIPDPPEVRPEEWVDEQVIRSNQGLGSVRRNNEIFDTSFNPPSARHFCLRSPFASRYGNSCARGFYHYLQKPSATFVQANANAKQKTEVCNIIKDLFDNGKYLKSACFVHQALTYEAAKQKCAENNMNLFIMNDEIIESQFLDAAQEKYPGGILWVNGKRQTMSKKWKVFDIDGSTLGPLSDNLNFYSNHAIGNCLQISGQYTGIFQPLPGNCAEGRYFACEHYKKTQSPPTLDTSKCLYKRDLHVKNKYIKSLCVVNQGLNYDQSRRKCAEYDMNLFIFDTAEVDEAFFEASEEILKTYAGGHFWVNGLRDPQTNQWYVSHSNMMIKSLLYEDFEWVRKDNINGISNGDCLWLSGERGPYQGIGVACTAGSWFICEYTKEHLTRL